MGWRYAALEDRFNRLGNIEGALAILEWDTAVIMPKGAVDARAEQLAALKRLAHELLTHDETGELLSAADEDDLDLWQQANLREMQRKYAHARVLEPRLVEALSRATTTCEMVWREARAKSDFAMLRPYLEELLTLVRESASIVGAALGIGPYDALLDAHQPDLRDSMIEPLFEELARELPGLVDIITARQAEPERARGPFPIDVQRALARSLMARLGFDFDRGRLDESTHPFCGGVPSDIRITTRYREDDVTSALMGVLHETGHALYEAGLPRRWLRQPVGEARGIAVHESQSLLVEMQVCRSPAFLGFLSSELKSSFANDPAFEAPNLRRLYHHVARSLIRVDADEVTYPLHIVLRWQLERALLSGDLGVADLPLAWAESTKRLLGIVPPNDREGCLQDIHWTVGAFGYFPNYTLGALLAAQLFQAASRDLPNLEDELARAEFEPLRSWLRRKVHEQASSRPFAELVQEATGERLTTRAFLVHLRQRYGA